MSELSDWADRTLVLAQSLGLHRHHNPAYPEPESTNTAVGWWRHLHDNIAALAEQTRRVKVAEEDGAPQLEAEQAQLDHITEVVARHGFTTTKPVEADDEADDAEQKPKRGRPSSR